MRHRMVVTRGPVRMGTSSLASPICEVQDDGRRESASQRGLARGGDASTGELGRPLLSQHGYPLRNEIEPIVGALQRLRRMIDDGVLPEESWQVAWEEIGGLFAEARGYRSEELTHRERQVLQLAAEGLRHRAIGQRLMIERDTVETYLKKVRQKLDVRSTPAAVAVARRRGWIR